MTPATYPYRAGHQIRHQLQRDELLAMTERLVAEYAGIVPAGTVMRCVGRCRERLLRTGLREGIVPATEAAARVRLAALLPATAAV